MNQAITVDAILHLRRMLLLCYRTAHLTVEELPPSVRESGTPPPEMYAGGSQTEGLAVGDSTQTGSRNVADEAQTECIPLTDETQTDNTAQDEAVQTVPPPPPT